MRALYTSVLVTHVLVAVLGIGSITSVAFVAGTARRLGRTSAEASHWLGPLLRVSAFSLVALLVTGALLDVVVGGAYHTMWWFRGSALLLVATGILNGQARRAVRRGREANDDGGANLRRVQRIAYGMCGLIAAITVLMEAKPF